MGSARVWGALALFSVAAFVALGAAHVARAQPRPPNIALVILDDVGVELFGAYNRRGAEIAGIPPPEHGVTPNIDALARAGLLFRNFWAMPLCKPTRAALFTGTFGLHNGAFNNDELAFDTLPTLPELLADAPVPYAARVAIGKWHLTEFDPYAESPGRAPTDVGFTAWAGVPRGAAYRYYPWAVDPPPSPAVFEFPEQYRTTRDLEEATAFVEGNPGGPWFLWLALKAGHSPWREAETPVDPSSWCNAIVDEPRRVRCRQLEIFDEDFGDFIAALEANDPGLANTTVILLGDNGSPVRAPDTPTEIPGQVNRGGKGTLYEGGLNVPLIVAGAGVAANDPATIEETAALVQAADVFATILELAGAEASGPAVDGLSFAPVLAGDSAPRRCLYVDGPAVGPSGPALHPSNHDVAVRNARYKLIRRAASEGADPYELYDLLEDPGETMPLEPKGSAFKELRAVLNHVDKNPLASPCSSKRQKFDCDLGQELWAVVLAFGVYRGRRRRG